MIDRSDTLWYKDAIIYQTHVKAFLDSTGDGVGDFAGLMQKLDYIQDLGVSAVWLLPFYPSPLRDDGYDIADYRRIHESYGTMRDFRRFVREAHRRGLRVITELVINHTSDQHPWFQRARRAKPGSVWRDYYVWSDTDQKYLDARIIFIDTEKSNWTWDPEAQAYYWHRFYSHQPDLNFDNPRVMDEVLDLLKFWLRMGIDGLRLDAIPYLIEREGTNCENLEETHAVLKRIRAELDRNFEGRMLLAEANQWPEDTRPYFGEGDECHMAFHFPLMPRMYMAIAQEDRHPITDIMRQTPDIPDNCQWAIFLRNHDELTLEMVTDTERDFLWGTYAADRRMRLNLGIRRRLAPLLENDRRKIELMNGLLFTMPGTPVVYYGDEIGMGDNVYLGDRDGVRTPMQWSSDRNGGFSRAQPQRLYLPPIMDPVYGYEAINVEAQQASQFSLLNWTKRMIAVRQAHKAFGRGSLTFLYPRNRKILAYLREYENERILCVFNLSRNAEAFDLDLDALAGKLPIELLGRTPFPPITEGGYRLALPGYGFYAFIISPVTDLATWHTPAPEPLPDFITLVLQGGWRAITEGRGRQDIGSQALPAYITKQRWFGGKNLTVRKAELEPLAVLPGDGEGYLLAEATISPDREAPQSYLLPLAIAWGEENFQQAGGLLPYTVARVRRGRNIGALHDPLFADDFPRRVLTLLRDGATIEGPGGRIDFNASPKLAELDLGDVPQIRHLGTEQSNTSVLIADAAMLKAYRRQFAGVHPELEIGRFLTDVAQFPNTPPLLGSVELERPDGTRSALMTLFAFAANQGDGWHYTLSYLDRALEAIKLGAETGTEEGQSPFEVYLTQSRLLGQRTAELHRAFAIDTDDEAFTPEPVTEADVAAWTNSALVGAERAFADIGRLRGDLPEDVREEAAALLDERARFLEEIRALGARPIDAVKTRYHGDYHLGQVLVAKGDFMIIDFEGEPARSMEERRMKGSAVKDVAGMLRSFDYAAWAIVLNFAESDPDAFGTFLPPAMDWRDRASAAFLEGYCEAVAGCAAWPAEPDQAARLLRLFQLEKGFYEISYEAANRPSWVRIPLGGVRALLIGREREELLDA